MSYAEDETEVEGTVNGVTTTTTGKRKILIFPLCRVLERGRCSVSVYPDGGSRSKQSREGSWFETQKSFFFSKALPVHSSSYNHFLLPSFQGKRSWNWEAPLAGQRAERRTALSKDSAIIAGQRCEKYQLVVGAYTGSGWISSGSTCDYLQWIKKRITCSVPLPQVDPLTRGSSSAPISLSARGLWKDDHN